MRVKQVVAEVERMRQAFLLNNWHIDVVCHDVETLEDDGTPARITWDGAYWLATITVATKREEGLIREAILHEVLHLVIAELVDTAEDIARMLGHEAYAVAHKRINDANEHTVRRFEFALVKRTE